MPRRAALIARPQPLQRVICFANHRMIRCASPHLWFIVTMYFTSVNGECGPPKKCGRRHWPAMLSYHMLINIL